MAKMKTITMVKPHYIGDKSLSEAFSGIIKQQIENNILLHDTENRCMMSVGQEHMEQPAFSFTCRAASL